MNGVNDQILIEALDLLEQGLSVNEILSRYPDDAADLQPFLKTAAALARLSTQPTIAAEQKSRAAFLAAAEMMTRQPAVPASRRLTRILAPIFALVAVIFLSGYVLVSAAVSAVPGDALYETKRSFEDFRLSWTSDPERAAALRDEFERRRLEEIEALLQSGREEAVSFTGTIELMSADGRWTIDGIPVRIGPLTAVDGNPAIGSLVQIDGRTGDGAVEADTVLVLTSPMDLPAEQETPTPEPTVTGTPTSTPTPAPTIQATTTPSPTLIATATRQPEATPTRLPEVTIEPTSVPVQPATSQPEPQPTPAPISPTATPDDDGNGNDDDGDDNDNGDANDNDDDNNDNDDDGGDDDGGDDNEDDNGDD